MGTVRRRGFRVKAHAVDADVRYVAMAIAEKVDKLQAICVRCGDLATRNQRLIDGKPAPAEGPVIQVGGLETYEARCRRCHEVPAVNRSQTRIFAEN